MGKDAAGKLASLIRNIDPVLGRLKARSIRIADLDTHIDRRSVRSMSPVSLVARALGSTP